MFHLSKFNKKPHANVYWRIYYMYSIIYTFIYSDFPYIYASMFSKSSTADCRFVVCGKGLNILHVEFQDTEGVCAEVTLFWPCFHVNQTWDLCITRPVLNFWAFICLLQRPREASESISIGVKFLTPLQQTAFWKHSDKRRICSKQAISSFTTMFSTFSHKVIHSIRDFLFFDKICPKSSAAELLYEGKGLALK